MSLKCCHSLSLPFGLLFFLPDLPWESSSIPKASFKTPTLSTAVFVSTAQSSGGSDLYF